MSPTVATRDHGFAIRRGSAKRRGRSRASRSGAPATGGPSSRLVVGDFAYFDPPYVPLSGTANFTAYAKAGFGLHHQAELADALRELGDCGVCAMLSNADTTVTRKLYRGLAMKKIRSRAIDLVRRSDEEEGGEARGDGGHRAEARAAKERFSARDLRPRLI